MRISATLAAVNPVISQANITTFRLGIIKKDKPRPLKIASREVTLPAPNQNQNSPVLGIIKMSQIYGENINLKSIDGKKEINSKIKN